MIKASLPGAAARVAALTALLLLVPWVAGHLTTEMAWTLGDYIAAAVLLFSAGMAYVLAARLARTAKQRFAIALLVLAALATVWAELAVGLFS
jgi:hypothetical protein